MKENGVQETRDLLMQWLQATMQSREFQGGIAQDPKTDQLLKSMDTLQARSWRQRKIGTHTSR